MAAKTKTVDLFSYTKAEYCIRSVDKGSISWDYGRKAMYPLWPEHILYQRWYAPEGYYHHEHPTTWGFELPFSGNLQVSIDGAEPLIIEPGTFLLHPAATPNTLRTGPAGFCNKASFGLCGTALTAFMANSAMLPSRVIRLPDPEPVFRKLKQLFELSKTKNPNRWATPFTFWSRRSGIPIRYPNWKKSSTSPKPNFWNCSALIFR